MVSPQITKHPKMFASFEKPHNREEILMIVRRALQDTGSILSRPQTSNQMKQEIPRKSSI